MTSSRNFHSYNSFFYVLKVGEVWKEISDELRVENVRPITPDQEAMETISKASVERAKGVAMLQGRLLDAENYQNLQDEKQLYAEVLYLLLVNFCYVMFNVSQAYCNVGGDVST